MPTLSGVAKRRIAKLKTAVEAIEAYRNKKDLSHFEHAQTTLAINHLIKLIQAEKAA